MTAKALLPSLIASGCLLITGATHPCPAANDTTARDAQTSLERSQELYSQTLQAEQKLSKEARQNHQRLLQKIENLSLDARTREAMTRKAHLLQQEIKTRALRVRNFTREAKSLAEELRSELNSIARLENEIQLWEKQAKLHKNKIQELQNLNLPEPDNESSSLKLSQKDLLRAEAQLHQLHQTLQTKNQKAANLATKLQKTLEPTP